MGAYLRGGGLHLAHGPNRALNVPSDLTWGRCNLTGCEAKGSRWGGDREEVGQVVTRVRLGHLRVEDGLALLASDQIPRTSAVFLGGGRRPAKKSLKCVRVFEGWLVMEVLRGPLHKGTWVVVGR